MTERNFHIRHQLQSGDIGYVTYLHGILYAQEYGFDYTFDGYVGEAMGQFAKSYRPEKDRLWVVEMDGHIVGSIAIVGQENGRSGEIAQLRWFLLAPEARGQKLGRKLVETAVQFCYDTEYKSIFLWTLSNLHAAKHLYLTMGFQLTDEVTHQLWGHELTEERYDLIF